MTDLEIAAKMVAKAKDAANRNISFSLSFRHFKKMMTQKRCSYTNIVLVECSDKHHPNQRSIDRVDASIGYTDENTVICTHKFNTMKGALTIEALHQILSIVNKAK